MHAAPIVLGSLARRIQRGAAAPASHPGRTGERFLETRRRRHRAVVPSGRALVAVDVERREHALAELRRFLEHGLRGFQAGVFESRQLRNPLQRGELSIDQPKETTNQR